MYIFINVNNNKVVQKKNKFCNKIIFYTYTNNLKTLLFYNNLTTLYLYVLCNFI